MNALQKISGLFAALILLGLAAGTSGCHTATGGGPEKSGAANAGPIWPAPPDEPRIVYVRSLAGPADIGVKGSAGRRFANWLAGTTAEDRKLVNPFGIATDDHGGVCLTDTAAKTVCYFNEAGRQWLQWNKTGTNHFEIPVAVVKSNNTLYVADSGLAQVLAFDLNGKLLFQINHDLERPCGLAIFGDHLFVTDSQRHCVAVFDLRGNFLSKFGKRGTGPGEFNFPTHVATDSQGRVYITDSLNSRVQVFDSEGRFLSEIGSAGDTSGHFGRPKGVAVDSFGHIYVADAVFDNIQIFDPAGRLLLNWGEGGTGPGQFAVPNGIAIGPDNRIYVSDCYNHRVQVFKYVGGK